MTGAMIHYIQLDLKYKCQIFKAKASSILLGLWYWATGKNEWIYQVRKMKCCGCKFNNKHKCGACGCFKQLKLRLEDENCPLDKW